MECLTMEEVFVVTWCCTALIGVAMGFLVYWIFEHDNKEDRDGQSGA